MESLQFGHRRSGVTDDSSLIVIVSFPGVDVTVAESLKGDLGMDSEWCDLWRMTLNASKTKTIIRYR